jgi:hypothetical protein
VISGRSLAVWLAAGAPLRLHESAEPWLPRSETELRSRPSASLVVRSTEVPLRRAAAADREGGVVSGTWPRAGARPTRREASAPPRSLRDQASCGRSSLRPRCSPAPPTSSCRSRTWTRRRSRRKSPCHYRSSPPPDVRVPLPEPLAPAVAPLELELARVAAVSNTVLHRAAVRLIFGPGAVEFPPVEVEEVEEVAASAYRPARAVRALQVGPGQRSEGARLRKRGARPRRGPPMRRRTATRRARRCRRRRAQPALTVGTFNTACRGQSPGP